MATRIINGYPFTTYTREFVPTQEMMQRSADFLQWMDTRRTVRDFSDKDVPKEVIENLIRTASTAPSGAHKQPWSFCAVSNADIKKAIRIAAEEEEYESYNGRMPAEWLDDLLPLQTDWHKEFLEVAPWLIIVFKKIYEPGKMVKRRITTTCRKVLA